MKKNLLLLPALIFIVLGVAVYADAADATKSKASVRGCLECHGVEKGSAPVINGQTEDFIKTSLIEFRDSKRPSTSMTAMLTEMKISDSAIMDAAKTRSAKTWTNSKVMGDKMAAKKVENMVRVCESCHGPKGMGAGEHGPRIAGQHADYLFSALKEYRASDRNMMGNAVNMTLTRGLSDDEFTAFAAYFSNLK